MSNLFSLVTGALAGTRDLLRFRRGQRTYRLFYTMREGTFVMKFETTAGSLYEAQRKFDTDAAHQEYRRLTGGEEI